jgi:hypothetical protein
LARSRVQRKTEDLIAILPFLFPLSYRGDSRYLSFFLLFFSPFFRVNRGGFIACVAAGFVQDIADGSGLAFWDCAKRGQRTYYIPKVHTQQLPEWRNGWWWWWCSGRLGWGGRRGVLARLLSCLLA